MVFKPGAMRPESEKASQDKGLLTEGDARDAAALPRPPVRRTAGKHDFVGRYAAARRVRRGALGLPQERAGAPLSPPGEKDEGAREGIYKKVPRSMACLRMRR